MKYSDFTVGSGVSYPIETDFVKGGCTLARTNGYTFDNRYVDLGMTASQYDIQNPSGMIQVLNNMPMSQTYYAYGGGIVNSKKMAPVFFYGRQTIPWKLECEDGDLNRAHVIEVL